jgi:hypothetical protein
MIREATPDYDDHNPLLLAILGAWVHCQAFDRALNKQLKPVSLSTPKTGGSNGPLMALLGLIVVSDRLQNLIVRATEESPQDRWGSTPEHPPVPSLPLHSLLR